MSKETNENRKLQFSSQVKCLHC